MKKQKRKATILKSVNKYKYLYLLSLPGFIYLILFAYKPMVGILMAFQDYNIISGISGSPWVGLTHFKTFFSGADFASGILSRFFCWGGGDDSPTYVRMRGQSPAIRERINCR